MTTQNVGVQGISWTVFGAECLGAVYDLRWMIIFCVVLIFADFWWGWRESAMRKREAITRQEKEKHKFRFSLAGRRTLNKAVDYMSYLLIGVLAGLAITEPMGIASHTTTAAIGIGFGCMFEISSIIGHVCYVKGWNIKINWKKLIVAILKFKWKELANVFENGIDYMDDDPHERHSKHHRPMQMDDYGQEPHHCGEDVNEEGGEDDETETTENGKEG